MNDYKSALSLISAFTKAITSANAKEEHKPSLSNLEGMKAYKQACGIVGKASFVVEGEVNHNGVIEFS